MKEEAVKREAINRDLRIILEVNHQAELFYPEAVRFGDHAAHALKAKRRSQLTGLENLAENTLKVSDVLDYVKRQTARFMDWQQTFPVAATQQERSMRVGPDPATTGFGECLLDYLEKQLKERRDGICRRLEVDEKSEENRRLRRRVYLLLVRQFIRSMVIEYEFRVGVSATTKGDA